MTGRVSTRAALPCAPLPTRDEGGLHGSQALGAPVTSLFAFFFFFNQACTSPTCCTSLIYVIPGWRGNGEKRSRTSLLVSLPFHFGLGSLGVGWKKGLDPLFHLSLLLPVLEACPVPSPHFPFFLSSLYQCSQNSPGSFPS